MSFHEEWNVPDPSSGLPLALRISVSTYFKFDIFFDKQVNPTTGAVQIATYAKWVEKKWMIPGKMLKFIMKQMKEITDIACLSTLKQGS